MNIEDYPELQDLDLAEDFYDECSDTIDTLVGSDHCWDIVTSEVIRQDLVPLQSTV